MLFFICITDKLNVKEPNMNDSELNLPQATSDEMRSDEQRKNASQQPEIADPKVADTETSYKFKSLPAEYDWVKKMQIRRIESGEMENFYGLNQESSDFRAYHGTLDSKIPAIAKDGMKAFEERPSNEPRIFVTTSPTMALWHSIENGPHDTLRKEGNADNSLASGAAILLLIQVNKDWLNGDPESHKPLPHPDWMKQAKGIKPENDKRIFGYKKCLEEELDRLKAGKEPSDFGMPFPTTKIPPEFIYVQGKDGSLIPVQEWASSIK